MSAPPPGAPGSPGERDFVVRLNEAFAAIGGFSYDYRWLVLVATFVVIGGSLVLAGQTRYDNSYEAYFDPTDPTYLAYEQYREDFGSDEVSYILYEAPGYEHGPWNLEVMAKIERLTEALSEAPFVYDVKTIANAELIRGVPDGIDIREIADEFPETQAELLALRDEFMMKPMLVGGIVSADGNYGAIIIEMDRSSTDPVEAIRFDPEGGDELANLYPQVTDSAIEAILAQPDYEGIKFYHSGDVPLNAIYNTVISDEGGRLDNIASLFIACVLLLSFRSLIAALAPVAVVQVCIIMCVAFIALVGWQLDMSFGSAPTLITAIGVAHSVHILSEFRRHLAKLGDRRAAITSTLYLVGTPCLLTSVTTAVGFLSMTLAPIKSISHSGVYTSFGVLAAFVMSLTLLTSLLSMGRKEMAGIGGVLAAVLGYVAAEAFGQPMPLAAGAALFVGAASAWLVLRFYDRGTQGAERQSEDSGRLGSALLAIAEFDIRHRKALLVAFAALFVVSFTGVARIVPDSNWLDDFSEQMPIKGITRKVDQVMGGTTNVIYLFDAGVEDGIKEPAVLREMERVQRLGEQYGDLVRKTYSIVDILKDLNQAFHGGDPAYYRIPETRELVAQYLILYEMSGGEEAEELVSSDYRTASVELRLKLAMTSETAALVTSIDESLSVAPLEASSVAMTGIGALWLKLLDYIVSSQVQSFLMAFGVISLMMVAIFRSLKIGLISMVPNLSPVVLTLGVMGWWAIPLDYSKVSIAAVAIGIAVDDTIHLVSRFRHEFLVHGNYATALREAMQDVGQALVITSVCLVGGFLVLTLSVFDSTSIQGILLATSIVAALIADFLLMPALVLSFQPFGPEGTRASLPEMQEAA